MYMVCTFCERKFILQSTSLCALLRLCWVLWTAEVTHSYSVYYRTEWNVFLPPALRVVDKPSNVRVAAEQQSFFLCWNSGCSVTPCYSPCVVCVLFFQTILWESVRSSRGLQSNFSGVILILGKKQCFEKSAQSKGMQSPTAREMGSFIVFPVGGLKVSTIADENSQMLNVVAISIIISTAELQQCLLQQEVVLRLPLPLPLETQFI